ncbi:MAG: hypothetical protein FWD26_03825 [Treponema sp.]|nr:hypothetical protein [Treponema sp.]
MTISAERIFFKLLNDFKGNEFSADPIALHKAFYDLYKLNPDKMKVFDFIIRVNPYSPKLEELIFYYQLCGILSRKNPKFIRYEINKDRLKEIDSEDIKSFELEKPKSFTDIFEEK